MKMAPIILHVIFETIYISISDSASLILCMLGNLSWFFMFADYQLFRKILSGIPTFCQAWIQIRPDILSGLIWVQTACNGYYLLAGDTIIDKEWRKIVKIILTFFCSTIIHVCQTLQISASVLIFEEMNFVAENSLSYQCCVCMCQVKLYKIV